MHMYAWIDKKYMKCFRCSMYNCVKHLSIFSTNTTVHLYYMRGQNGKNLELIRTYTYVHTAYTGSIQFSLNMSPLNIEISRAPATAT